MLDPSDPSNSTQYRPIRLRKPSEEIKQLGQGNEALAEALLKVIEWPELSCRQTIDGYRSALSTVALELQADPLISSAGMTVKLITTTHDLKLVPEDLANDCFHLSNIGQGKLAKAIMAGK